LNGAGAIDGGHFLLSLTSGEVLSDVGLVLLLLGLVSQDGQRRGRDVVVLQDTAEGTIETIADVGKDVGLSVGLTVLVRPGRQLVVESAGDDGADVVHGVGGEVAAGLSDDMERGDGGTSQGSDLVVVEVGREELVGLGADGGSHVGEGDARVIISGETTAEIEHVHGVALSLASEEDLVAVLDGLGEGVGGGTATAHVERTADDSHTQLLGDSKEVLGVLDRGTELGGELADRVRVISDDTDDGLRDRSVFNTAERILNLVQLILRVEGHLGDTHLGGKLDIGGQLGRVGEDDTVRRATDVKAVLDFSHGGTIKTTAMSEEGLDEDFVGVALHRKPRVNTGQHAVPLGETVLDSTHIEGVERTSSID